VPSQAAFQLHTQRINASRRKSLTITSGTTFIFIFFRPVHNRSLAAFVLFVASVYLLGIGSPVFSRAGPPERLRPPLTFAERVAYQYAIEEVYWDHRIWPKGNPGPKPPLDAVVSKRQIEQKVEDLLRKSQLAVDQRGWRISSNELQAEMDRMAARTKQPRLLRELFDALGEDPFVIAECLARPILAGRVLNERRLCTCARNGRPVSGIGNAARAAFAPDQTHDMYKPYTLPEISGAMDCGDDTWISTSTANAPDGRAFYTTIWTGSEMIIWGGFDFNGRLNTGGKYDPITDSWTSTSFVNAPSPRDYHSAVWTGSEMIVWGGEPILNTGARYNPIADSWMATSRNNAPAARAAHTAVWTGTEMIVWGGRDDVSRFNTGGRYDPNTDSWTATGTTNAPEARWAHTVEWTGSQMIVWGGTNQIASLNSGGKYNLADNLWTPTNTANAPLGRFAHTTVWTGSEMIVWGGVDSTSNDANTGGRYNPSTDSWIATNVNNAPSPRDSHTAVWTGNEMIVWAGIFKTTNLDTGGRYEPGTDNWMPTSSLNAPLARENHTAVWTDTEMIVWGGLHYPSPFLNTGGRYCASSGPTPTATPSATSTPTPTPTVLPRITPVPRNRPTPPPRP
jgi:N-acetylneuraminic acid mutarotase